MKKITLLFTFTLLCFSGFLSAQHNFGTVAGPTLVAQSAPVTININDVGNSAGAPASPTGTYTTFSVSVDWIDNFDAWSSEADLSVITTAGTVLIDPATTGSANSGNATTMTFVGEFTAPYNPSTDGFLDILLRQSFGGSSANWSNIVVTIFPAPACIDPAGLLASNITTTSVDLTWTDPSGTQFDYEYVVQAAGVGIPAGAGNYIDIGDLPHTELGLTPGTSYEFWVRADCGANGFSNWAGPFNFNTPCLPYTVPYFEGFEAGYAHNTAVGLCLSQASVTGAQVWTANNSLTDYNRAPRTGAWNAFLRYSNEDWLFIPIQLVGGTSYTVEAYARQDGGTAANSNIAISYGTANNAAAMTNVITPATGIINGAYQLITGVFTPATDGVYYIGIKGFMNGAPWYISLDDISVFESPACLAPTALNVTALTSSSANLGWTESGSATSWDIEWGTFGFTPTGTPTISGATNPQAISGLSSNTAYSFYVRADCEANGFSTWAGPFNFTTNTEVICGTPVNTTHCYTNNDATTWTFTSNDGSPLRVTFNAGGMEACCDEIIIYDGTDVTGTILYQGNNGGNLAGLTFDSTTDSIHIVIDADGSISCSSGSTCCTAQFDFTVTCATCVNPTATFTSVPDCVNSEFSIDVNLTNLGSATSVSISDGTTTLTNISTTGIQTFGPYTDASNVTIVITNEQDGACTINSGNITNICPPTNDTCPTAIVVNCDDVVAGSTANGATNTGGNTAADVWYSYSGDAGDITLSLCTNTNFDTFIRVYDACGGTQIASNDDFCGTGSQVTFAADGASTYYIMVEGFGTATGNFELTVTCVLNANSFDNNNFMAYPNPVKDVLNLSYTSEISTVRVMNMLGQEVISRNLNTANAQVDMSQLSAGTYIVNVAIGDAVKTIKVVKQ